jgi:polyribonucleotide nucleotidyltransferase
VVESVFAAFTEKPVNTTRGRNEQRYPVVSSGPSKEEKSMEISLSTPLGDKSLTIRSGKLAKQAGGAVQVQYGDTIVLVTAVAAHEERAADFLPLTVEYQEKIYAAGRIPGNYFRREIGRPSEKEILTSRLTDRPIRPLFPKGWRYETQVIATVLSMDQENDPDVLAVLGASAALTISDIHFAGPIACVRVGRVDGQFIANPSLSQSQASDISLIVAGSKTGVVMVEAYDLELLDLRTQATSRYRASVKDLAQETIPDVAAVLVGKFGIVAKK